MLVVSIARGFSAVGHNRGVMVHFDVDIAFALITGTIAGVFSLLSWEVFRHSPVGKAVFALAVMMSLFVVYYAVIFALGADLLLAKVLQSLIYTVLVAFIGMMIDARRRAPATGGEG